MRSGAIIYPLLRNYADLTALVPATKIFAIRGQQPTGGPYIVYRESYEASVSLAIGPVK
jgi:hypothetical protein